VADEKNNNNPRSRKSILEITKEIANLHNDQHSEDPIPGSGRDVIIT
jgi:hypothetical protein